MLVTPDGRSCTEHPATAMAIEPDVAGSADATPEDTPLQQNAPTRAHTPSKPVTFDRIREVRCGPRTAAHRPHPTMLAIFIVPPRRNRYHAVNGKHVDEGNAGFWKASTDPLHQLAFFRVPAPSACRERSVIPNLRSVKIPLCPMPLKWAIRSAMGYDEQAF